jgi:hypothetical protein
MQHARQQALGRLLFLFVFIMFETNEHGCLFVCFIAHHRQAEDLTELTSCQKDNLMVGLFHNYQLYFSVAYHL